MIGKYFNKMPFAVNFRKVWEPGAPKVTLKEGELIEGPSEYLGAYTFLAPIPIEFHKVDSMTAPSQQFTFLDGTNFKMEIQENNHYSGDLKELKKIEPEETKEEVVPIGMSFDPKTVNWLSVKTVELEAACKFLEIDISHLNGMKKKEKKWELVKLIKAKVNIE